MTNTLSEKIDQLFAAEKWTEARALLEKELAKPRQDRDHWLLTRLSTTYYEQRQYKKALQLVNEARRLSPDCPLVLWDYAGTLDALGESQKAIEVYLSLIQRGVEKLSGDECGEGEEWAIGFLTDCHYRISVCLRHLHRPVPAWKFFVMWVKLLGSGAESQYAVEQSDVLKHLYQILLEHPGEKRPRSPKSALRKFCKEAERLLAAA